MLLMIYRAFVCGAILPVFRSRKLAFHHRWETIWDGWSNSDNPSCRVVQRQWVVNSVFESELAKEHSSHNHAKIAEIMIDKKSAQLWLITLNQNHAPRRFHNSSFGQPRRARGVNVNELVVVHWTRQPWDRLSFLLVEQMIQILESWCIWFQILVSAA